MRRPIAVLHKRWKLVTAGVVVATLVGSAGVWWVATNERAGVDCSTLQADGFNEANALAIACDSEVEVVGERTPWETSWAGPNGTTRLEMTTVPTRTQIGDEWVPVDPGLVFGDETIDVAAGVFPIALNPGGEQGASDPLATIERNGHVLDVWFPLELPVPSVEGSRAIYDFGEGIRLAVTVNVDATGIASVVELESPIAAERFLDMLENDRLTDGTPGAGLEIGYAAATSDGLTLTVDEFSQTIVTDAEGETQFYAPPPIMWDSAGETVDYDAEVTEVASTDRLAQPSAGDKIVSIAASLADSTIVVRPDEATLNDPATVWPVYIDPAFSGYGASERIAVRTGGYTSTLYQWTNISSSSPGEGAGLCSEVNTCNVVFRQRLVWKFVGLSTVANLAGADIQSASFTVNGVHSYSCAATLAALWRTADISAASNWSLSWVQQLGTRTESQRPSCGTNGYRSFDAKAGFVWMADANSTTISLGLATDDSSMTNWKRFAHDATISVTYNRAPAVPTSMQMTSPPVTGCVSGEGRPAIASLTPTLSAIVSDPDGNAVQASFAVRPVAELDKTGSQVRSEWRSGNLTAITSGLRASTAVPSGELEAGVPYAWRVRGYDGSRYSSYSGWCEFIIDTTAPSMPTVAPVTTGVAVSYVENAERGGVGLQGKFTLTRNSADTDVVAFRYGFNAPSMPSTIAPDSSGNATIAFTPLSAGPVTLSVRTQDAAGNFSPTRTYVFSVVTPTEDGIWTLDEGTGVTAANSVGAPSRPLTLNGPTWGSGPHELFDSRQGDHALQFDGVNDFASTTAPIVDTADSFAISTHVLLDPTRIGGGQSLSVVSQDAVDRGGFRVEYSASCPGMTQGCWSFSMPNSATGTGETVARSAVPVTGGEWVNLVAEYDKPAQEMRLWVCEVGTPSDPAVGEPVSSSVSRTATPWSTSGSFALGRSLFATGYARFWDGSIDNVRVFSGEVVSEAKIRRLCQGAEATDFPQGNTALDPTTTVGG